MVGGIEASEQQVDCVVLPRLGGAEAVGVMRVELGAELMALPEELEWLDQLMMRYWRFGEV